MRADHEEAANLATPRAEMAIPMNQPTTPYEEWRTIQRKTTPERMRERQPLRLKVRSRRPKSDGVSDLSAGSPALAEHYSFSSPFLAGLLLFPHLPELALQIEFPSSEVLLLRVQVIYENQQWSSVSNPLRSEAHGEFSRVTIAGILPFVGLFGEMHSGRPMDGNCATTGWLHSGTVGMLPM
jgi:hypothetical protein